MPFSLALLLLSLHEKTEMISATNPASLREDLYSINKFTSADQQSFHSLRPRSVACTYLALFNSSRYRLAVVSPSDSACIRKLVPFTASFSSGAGNVVIRHHDHFIPGI
jgi:hypothetical protein